MRPTSIRHRENAPAEQARRATSALVRRHGRPLGTPASGVTHTFPAPEALAAADPTGFPVNAVRARAIHVIAGRVADGAVRLDAGAELEEAIGGLLAVPGIGPWIASYIAMRALGDPDALLLGCARVERALGRLGVDTAMANVTELARGWRPWRSYAIAQLWRSLDDEAELP